MQEQVTTVEESQETVQVEATVNPFDETSWKETPVETKPLDQQQIAEQQQAVQTEVKTKEDEELLDENDYVKKTLGFDSVEEAKKVIEEYNKLKSQPKSDFEFANEESKKFFEYLKEGKEDDVYNYLSQKKRVEKLIASEITEDTAAEIVKFDMKNKYSNLTDEQIEHKFKKQFSIPKEPVKGELEDEEDFEQRKLDWQEKVKEVKMDLLIEANLAKPNIEKLKFEIVLPEIKKAEGEKAQELNPEELGKLRESYLLELENESKNFAGFNVTYKTEEGEVPIAFTLAEDERSSFKEKLKDFDPVDFIMGRWLKPDGSRNIQQLMEDVYALENRGKIHQKLVNEAGAKALENYIKSKKNISVGATQQVHETTIDNKTEMDKLAATMFGS